MRSRKERIFRFDHSDVDTQIHPGLDIGDLIGSERPDRRIQPFAQRVELCLSYASAEEAMTNSQAPSVQDVSLA